MEAECKLDAKANHPPFANLMALNIGDVERESLDFATALMLTLRLDPSTAVTLTLRV